MSTSDLLVRLRPGAKVGSLSLHGRALEVELEPLLPSAEAQPAGLGAAAAPAWHLARVPDRPDGVSPWDLCHQALTQGLGIAGGPAVSFAEPDLEHQWLWTDDHEEALALSDKCARHVDGPLTAPYGVPKTPTWYRETAQLKAARERVGAPAAKDRVRIAHLDTGYDPNHQTVPANVRKDLAASFSEDNDAANGASHGTFTIALLAGGDYEGSPLGAAAHLEVVPLRIANSVVLFRTSALARAFDHVHGLWGQNDSKRVHVITLSMGGVASAAWATAVNALYERGIVLVAAAGNCIAGVPPSTVYPARFNRSIAAAGVMSDGRPYADLGLRMAGCYGPKSKLKTTIAGCTPNVPRARAGCSSIVDKNAQGTSAATPQVASAAALWIQQHKAKWDAYPEGWMKVEAVRHALFSTAQPGDSRLGKGALRADKALSVAPPAAADLRKQEADSASFSILRVLTGLGAAPPSSTSQQMLELEALQVSQRSREVSKLMAGLDHDEVPPEKARDILEAIADAPGTSGALRSDIAKRLGKGARTGRVISVPTAPVAKAATLAPTPSVRRGFVEDNVPAPVARPLRVFAFDPLTGTSLDTADITETTIDVAWESKLLPGPVGEYLEVVDVDPPSGVAYEPVDLNRPELLVQGGIAPNEGNPQFHQQMVYAVAMKTIACFERALGRVALWAERPFDRRKTRVGRFVRRLRIYPHALREANAYYSPDKCALLFGYFDAGAGSGNNLPGGTVFTCLSHDIVAHEMTHALLDGLHPRFREASNPDSLAFHEAFADIVALFQHFTLPEALKHQIAKARGDLASADLLGGLAVQFGEAIGNRGALRHAIGQYDEAGRWVARQPKQTDYAENDEPHARGAVLVSAIFDAFIQIYRRRTDDLVRLATQGTGVLPPGRIPHELVERLSQAAAKSADEVLRICVRALDYCPPVDLTFGEYLRALITADHDLVLNDKHRYRVAFISAFRARGIFPPGVRSLSVDSLLWQPPSVPLPGLSNAVQSLSLRWQRNIDRYQAYRSSKDDAARLHGVISDQAFSDEELDAMGVLRRPPDGKVTIDGVPGSVTDIEVHSVRPARRVGPEGEHLTDVIVELTQSWLPEDGGKYRGGSTLICSPTTGAIRYVIRKRVGHSARVGEQQAFAARAATASLHGNYFSEHSHEAEPFALVHRGV